jgi:L-serine dehydratase
LYDQKNKVSIEMRLLSAYAYATSEVNASGGTVVTAPTCGASGVLPSLLYFLRDIRKYSDERIIDGLATAGIIGNIVKHNASISGAEAGCQAEVGTACAMAAAAYSELENGSIETIEYAAEIALEHHLGLTCDPILGYVQIPCIERNAVAAVRAMNAGELATLLMNTRLISFDTVVETMKETGKDLLESYKETSIGGLAKFYQKKVS